MLLQRVCSVLLLLRVGCGKGLEGKPRILPRTQDPAFATPLTNKTKMVIMVTLFRSGSTFLGELFNQNPDVMYDFEPFHYDVGQSRRGKGYIAGELPRHTPDELNLLYLQQVLATCRVLPNTFSNMHKYWKCGRNAKENLDLHGQETCEETMMTKNIFATRQYMCQHKDAVAFKVIRLRRLRDLELIHDIHNTDLRVVHLLRDPRAMFRSRSGFGNIFAAMRNQVKWSFRDDMYTKLAIEAHTECENYNNDMSFAERSPWLRDRYLAVKHDEMSIDPLGVADKVYKFVGLPVHPDVTVYLKGLAGAGEVLKAAPKGPKVDNTGVGGALSTIKDSKEVLDKWPKWLIPRIQNVDKHCARFVRKAGWTFLSEPEILNHEFEPL